MKTNNAKRLNKTFWLYMVMTLLREVIENCFNDPTTASIFSYFLFFYAIMAIYLCTDKIQQQRTLLLLAIVVAFFGVNYALFPPVREYILNNAVVIATGSLPLMLFLANVSDYEDFLRTMQKFAYPYVALSVLYVILKYMGVVSEEIDYMQVAYYVLLPICILGYLGIYHNNIVYKVSFFALLFAILLLGSRGGALVGFMVYASLYIAHLKKQRRRFALIILTFILGFVVANLDSVLGGADTLLVSYGYEGRITDKLETGSLFQSEGRELRQTVIMASIVQNNYAPFGVFGDRELTKSVTATGDASYAHNFILEFIVDFGLIGGIVVLVLLIWWIVRCYKRADIYARGVILLFAVYSLVKLSLSMSYLIEETFYCLLGVLVSCSIVYKNQKKRGLTIKS